MTRTTTTLALTAIALLALLAPAPAGAATAMQKVRALDGEPDIRAVQQAALRYYGVDRDATTSMRSRAKWKALAPVMEVYGGYTSSDLGEDTTMYEFSTVEPWVVRGADGTAWDVRGKLSWDLPRLVFNAEELDVASVAGLVEGILKEVTGLYYARRRLQVDLILNPPSDPATLLSQQIRVEELTALLDAMTGGWYQRQLDGPKKPAPRG